MMIKWNSEYELLSIGDYTNIYDILPIAVAYKIEGKLEVLKEINKECENLELKDFSFLDKIKQEIEIEIQNALEV